MPPQKRLRLPPPAFHPATWLTAFLCWFATLWWLSSGVRQMHHAPPIPFLDKILHFGWFLGGAGLLSAFLLRLRPDASWPRNIALLVVAVIAATGALDEWHQSWIPGRSGNDLGDWLADLAGAVAGVFIFQRFGRPLLTSKPRT